MPFLRANVAPVNPDPNEVERPSNWHEDQNERDVPPDLDYPTEVVAEPDLGFVPPPDPTPVYLTEPPPGGNSIVKWSAGNIQLTTSWENIAGADRKRKKMVLVNNDDTDTIYLFRRTGDININGYPLKPGKDVTFEHNDEVWAHTIANDAELAWYIEYGIEE